jgi:hypothetical protein
MQKLTWADQRKISEFARDLYCLDSVQAISERVVQRFDTLIGGNSTVVVLNERIDLARTGPSVIPHSR